MELSPGVALTGKYKILSLLYNEDNYNVYLVNAPTLGEEFIITEFFPHDMVGRDEDDFIVIPFDRTDEFEKRLSKFSRDCEKIMHLTINRYLGIREILSDKGTAYVVTRKPVGNLANQYLLENPNHFTMNNPVIGNLYEGMKAASEAEIAINLDPDSAYIDDAGVPMFLFKYLFEYNETSTVCELMKLFYFFTTAKRFEEEYKPELITGNDKFSHILKVILGSGQFSNFNEADIEMARYDLRINDNAPLKTYIKPALVFLLVLGAVAAASAIAVYLIAGKILG